jgi:hypothetical protein
MKEIKVETIFGTLIAQGSGDEFEDYAYISIELIPKDSNNSISLCTIEADQHEEKKLKNYLYNDVNSDEPTEVVDFNIENLE